MRSTDHSVPHYTRTLHVTAVRKDSVTDTRLIAAGLELAAITNEHFDIGRSQLVRKSPYACLLLRVKRCLQVTNNKHVHSAKLSSYISQP